MAAPCSVTAPFSHQLGDTVPSARTNKMACSNGFAHPTIESPGMQVTSSLNPPDMRKVHKQTRNLTQVPAARPQPIDSLDSTSQNASNQSLKSTSRKANQMLPNATGARPKTWLDAKVLWKRPKIHKPIESQSQREVLKVPRLPGRRGGSLLVM